MLKAKYLQAADDYNAEHRLEGQWLGPVTRAGRCCGQIDDYRNR
jgi:hypothetical protein